MSITFQGEKLKGGGKGRSSINFTSGFSAPNIKG